MGLVVFNQTCLLVYWKSKRKATWPMLLLQTCQLTLSAKTATLQIQHTCQVESCYVAAAATYMSAGLVLLSPTPLLFKQACWLSAAARWMLAGLWPLYQHACWSFVTQYCMSAGGVLLYLLYLLVWCLTISRACWYGVSLSALPASELLHYRSCLLVWYLTISLACWCCASL